jgi:AsmA protein
VIAAMGAARRVTGPVNLSLQLETEGESPMALMRSMDGKVSLSMKQGELLGINLPDLLAKIEKRPLTTAFDVRGGRTPFETAQLSGRISDGVFEIGEGLIQSPAARVTLTGQIGLADRLYAVTGQANAVNGTNGGTGITLPFEISGALEDPVLMPDARSLIRRSGAAAPFFEPKRPAAPVGSPAMADGASPTP